MSGYVTIKLRRGTAAQWTASNPILAEGEVGLETDTRKFKVGDGATVWASLQYWQTGGGGGATDFTDLGDVPASYASQGGKLVRVKADESGLEFFTYTIAAGDLPTGIDAAKIGSGNVSNTEFGYLDGVTSAIQTQLNGKATEGTNAAFTSVNINGTAGNGHIHLKHQSADPTISASNTGLWADAAGNLYMKNDGNAKTLLLTAEILAALTAKTTPVDADTVPLTDSADSNVLKKLSWANIKATLKTYFDTLYQAAGAYITASSTDTLTNKTFNANGTGNSITNLEVADFAAGVVDTDLSSVSASDDTIPSAKATKAALDGKASSTFVDAVAGVIETPADGDYRVVVNMPYAGTINSTTTRSASGTCTATFKVNTTALGGTANSVSSSEQEQSHSSSNTFVAGDDIVITVSANSSCSKMSFLIKVTRSI